MKIICVIPARYKSSRFPGKPLADINGKPMIWWTYHQAIKVRGVDEVMIATDDERIEKVCKSFKMKCVMTSVNHLTGTDRLAEVSQIYKADLYINIQGDEPLIEPELIEKMIEFMQENTEYICATVRSPIHNPVDVINTTVSKVVCDLKGDILYISKNPIPFPKASLNVTYYKALGTYIFRPSALDIYRNTERRNNECIEDIEMLRLVENGIKVRAIDIDSNSPSVDTYKDLKRIENMIMLKKRGKNET